MRATLPASLAGAAMWLSRYERLWAESFGRLDDYLARLTSEQPTTENRDERSRP